MTADFNKAAAMAAETLVKYSVKKTPVSVLPILDQMDNVIVISFAEMGEISGIDRKEILPIFGKFRDAVTSVHNGDQYIVAYNSLLPFAMIQKALARELAHIVLKHKEPSPEAAEEAQCFAAHLLCPRPLIHSIQAIGIRLTEDLIANLTGIFDQTLIQIRHIPGTAVPFSLNRFVRSQMMPFIVNFFDYYQTVRPKDGSALADLGTFMEGYEE